MSCDESRIKQALNWQICAEGAKMKTSVPERYVVVIENEGEIELAYWCETLAEARQEVARLRRTAEDIEEKRSMMVLKVLRI